MAELFPFDVLSIGSYSGSFSGSFQGDGSKVTNVSASNAISASYALTASYAVNHKIVTSTYVVQGKLSSNQLIPTASDTTIQFVDDFDPNNWWDASTYRFTPTIAGYYNISFGVWFDNMATTSSNQINAQVRKNGNTFIIIQQPCQNGTGISLGGTKIAYLNGSSDYIDFTAYNGALASKNILQGNASGSGTWFSAILITQ